MPSRRNGRRKTRRLATRTRRIVTSPRVKSGSKFIGRGFKNYAIGSVALAGINSLPVTRRLGPYKQGVDMAIVGTALKGSGQGDLQTAGIKSVLSVVMQQKLLPSLLSASAGFNLAGILGVGNGNGNGSSQVSSIVNEEAL